MKTRQVSEFKETEIGKIPSDWDLKELKQIADVIDPHPSHRAPKEVSIGFPFAGIGDIDEDGTINVDKARKINEEYVKQQEESYEINDYSIGYGRVGTVGKIVKLKKKEFRYALSPTLAVINPNNQIDKIFLNFAIRTESFANQVYSRMTGTTRPALGIQELRKILVIYPPIKEQRSIGKILDDLTNKIQNLQNQNKIIEQIAQAIFKSWFIDFDGQMEFVESELGKIPKGWMIKKMSEISEVKIGRTPPRKEAEWFTKNIGMKWVSIRDMGLSNTFLHYTLENLTDDAIKNFKIPVIEKGMVLLSFKLTVGRVAIASEKMVSNEAIAHFKISEPSLNNYYLYEVLKNFNYDSLGSTSSIATAINSTNIKDMKIIVPTIEILNQFKETVESLFSQINVEQKKIQILSNTRDLLLIKSVSGEIRV